MDSDAVMAAGNVSLGGTPTPDDQQKQGSDDGGREAGQIDETDADPDAGMVDGETDAEVDLVAVGWENTLFFNLFFLFKEQRELLIFALSRSLLWRKE